MFSLKRTTLFSFCFIPLLLAALSSCASSPRREPPIMIPFTLENCRMVIYAEVNGVEGRFLWDTVAFDTHTFTSLENLTPVPEYRSPFPLVRSYYIEDGIVINGQIIRSKSIIRYLPHPYFPPGFEFLIPYLMDNGFDGILGMAIFNGWWVEVSFSTNNIILHRQRPRGFANFASAYTAFQGLYSPRGAFLVYGIVDGMYVDFLLNTGAAQAFNFPHWSREYLDTSYRRIIALNDAFYEIPTSNIRLMGEVFYGKTIRTNSFAESIGAAFIGLEFLQHYDFLFDMRTLRPRRTRLYYRPSFARTDAERSFTGIYSPGVDYFGIRIRLEEQGFFVSTVIAPSFEHDELGLMPGMTLTSFNGRSLAGLEPTELSTILAYLKGGGSGELAVLDADGTERVIVR